MEEFTYQTAAEDMLRCYLAALIHIAGDTVPRRFNGKHPDPATLPVSMLKPAVDSYTLFLRTP